MRGALPVTAQVRQEAGTALRGFVENLVAALPVIADGRCADESARRIRPRLHGPDQSAGRVQAAVDQPFFLRRRPATVADVLAGEVDHDTGIGELPLPRAARSRVPLHPTAGLHTPVFAAEDDHVGAIHQAAGKWLSDESRTAGNHDLHDAIL